VSPAPVHTLAEILIDSASIQRRIRVLAGEIDREYANLERPLVLICVLKGSLLFTADLSRRLSVPLEYEFVACRSYGDEAASSGVVELVRDAGTTLRDRDVLVVEDIIDTGLTTSFLLEHLAGHHPRSLRLVVLLSKTRPRHKDVHVDFRGFDIPDRFVVGYGLDLAERYRNLPDVHLVAGA
jgi:hypoxanthine phosphoribosyltransferase